MGYRPSLQTNKLHIWCQAQSPSNSYLSARVDLKLSVFYYYYYLLKTRYVTLIFDYSLMVLCTTAIIVTISYLMYSYMLLLEDHSDQCCRRTCIINVTDADQRCRNCDNVRAIDAWGSHSTPHGSVHNLVLFIGRWQQVSGNIEYING